MVSLALLFLGLVSISQCFSSTDVDEKNQDYCKRVLSGEKPYQISVQSMFIEHLCSGALLTYNFAITAAHCVANRNGSELFVVPDKMVLESGYRTDFVVYAVPVVKIITPENYNISEPCHDNIALLVLKDDLRFTIIETVSLPLPFDSQNESNKEYLATFSGYEKVEVDLPYPERLFIQYHYHLFQADSYIISHKNCSNYYRNSHCPISDTQICTFDWSAEIQPRIRDEGAILIYNGTLLGIATCAKDCSQPQLPNVFTNISKYVPWIQKEISLAS